jgi:hypothetical protein
MGVNNSLLALSSQKSWKERKKDVLTSSQVEIDHKTKYTRLAYVSVISSSSASSSSDKERERDRERSYDVCDDKGEYGACGNAAGELRDPIQNAADESNAAAQEEGECDGGVDVAPRYIRGYGHGRKQCERVPHCDRCQACWRQARATAQACCAAVTP